ncbi:hypothetical protein NXS19_004868 [Fusarium pseudograminearum]|nr:hypothetical protein NXS19_004868 [Fusarium pseudograminearum]
MSSVPLEEIMGFLIPVEPRMLQVNWKLSTQRVRRMQILWLVDGFARVRIRSRSTSTSRYPKVLPGQTRQALFYQYCLRRSSVMDGSSFTS